MAFASFGDGPRSISCILATSLPQQVGNFRLRAQQILYRFAVTLMEPEDLTLWQERHLIDRWGNKIFQECVEKGVSNTEYYAEYKRFLDVTGGDCTASQFVQYFGAAYLEACLFSGWIKSKDLGEWGLRGAYQLDRKGIKKPVTKGRVFSPSDVRKIENRWQVGEYPDFAPEKF